MAYVTRPKPTSMIVCDLCDEEIAQGEDGGLSRANLMTKYSPIIQATNRWEHLILSWGRSRTRPEERTVSYDFHGKCIAALVEREIAARKSTSSEAAS